MTEHTKDIHLIDPLSEVTRKERRMLLGLSMLGIFFVKAGVLPSKISALGVEMTSSDQSAFLYLMSFGLVYFVCAFFIYAMTDFIVWRKAITRQYLINYRDYIKERDGHPIDPHAIEMQAEEEYAHKRNMIWQSLTNPMSITRAAFEFALPLIVGIYSIIVVVAHASTST